MAKLLLIGLDSVGNLDFPLLLQGKAFQTLTQNSIVVRSVSNVFLNETAPVYASVLTGTTPEKHGVLADYSPELNNAVHYTKTNLEMQAKPIWKYAKEKGLETAAVNWPCTTGVREIKWNIPEVHEKNSKAAFFESLGQGSKLLQLSLMLQKKLPLCKNQPEYDLAAANCMAKILTTKKPTLALVRFTSFDLACREAWKYRESIFPALHTLDTCLGILLSAISQDTQVLLFSSGSLHHKEKVLYPNDWLVNKALMKKENQIYKFGNSNCFFECHGGSAFFHKGQLPEQTLAIVKQLVEESEGFERFLTEKELQTSGKRELAFGFVPKTPYFYETYPSGKIAMGGFPSGCANNRIFYTLCASNIHKGRVVSGGNLLDITALAAKILGLSIDGFKVRPDLFLGE